MHETTRSGTSLMHMPTEILSMITDLVMNTEHEAGCNQCYHIDDQVVVITAAYDTWKPTFLAPLRSPSRLPISLLRTNRTFNDLGNPGLPAFVSKKRFHFTNLDVFWAFHTRHPRIARLVKKVDVTAYGHMAFAGMALLLRHQLDELILRSGPVPYSTNPIWQIQNAATRSTSISRHLNQIFAGLSSRQNLYFEPLLVRDPQGNVHVNEDMDPDTPDSMQVRDAFCDEGTIVGDALSSTFAADRSIRIPPVTVPPPEDFDLLVAEGWVSACSFAGEREMWLTDAVVEMFTEGLEVSVDQEGFRKMVHQIQFLVSFWEAVDRRDAEFAKVAEFAELAEVGEVGEVGEIGETSDVGETSEVAEG